MTSTTTTAGTTSVWTFWVDSSSTTGSVSSDGAWSTWVSSGTVSLTGANSQPRATLETEEQRLAREERERLHRERMEQARREREEAGKRAEALLLSLLTRAQRKELKEQNTITVFSELRKRYRIRRGQSMNVDELDDGGRVVAKLCAYPTGGVPVADTMAAQLLTLKHNEREFLRVANRTAVRQ